VAGIIGKKAIRLDGKSLFVDTGNGGYPNCTAGLASGSFSFWINSTNTATKQMVVHTSSASASFSVRLNYNKKCNYATGGVYCQLRNQHQEKLEFALANPLASGWADGHWHLITVTWRATTGAPGTGSGAIYVDGVSKPIAYNENAIADERSFDWHKLPVVIGANSSADGIGVNYHLMGTIDDVAAWRGPLDEARIKALYNLCVDPELNYGAKDEQMLANVFASQGAGKTSDGKTWQYVQGLVGRPGDVLNHNTVVFDDNGNGVQVVPAQNRLDPAPFDSSLQANARKGGFSSEKSNR